MDDARYVLSHGGQTGTVVCTGFQSEGRGRFRHRKWYAEPGESLLFTLILGKNNLDFPSLRIPLLLGLAVSLLCEREYGFSALIKWPNDMYYADKKFAGILCQAEKDSILCGIGINANQVKFPGEPGMKAVSLRMITAKEVDRIFLCEQMLVCIKETLAMQDWHIQLERRLYKTGSRIKVIQSGNHNNIHNAAEGILSGIDTDGALLIKEEKSGRLERIISGEILFQEM
jgi:BirA family biotin operon repressor/biotin-[acetyl-CoA-carboxylase] ligase